MSSSNTIPVPENEEDPASERRLWIGNLDLRISEFLVLKLVQKFGKPERFDYIYHTVGPEKGKPKGYCFVTYPTKEIALKALQSLNGKLALSRRLIVHWANEERSIEPLAPLATLSVSSEPKPPESLESTENKIRAIEAKLNVMQQTQDSFAMSTFPAAPPGSSRYSSVNAVRAENKSSGRGRRRPFQPATHRYRRR